MLCPDALFDGHVPDIWLVESTIVLLIFDELNETPS